MKRRGQHEEANGTASRFLLPRFFVAVKQILQLTSQISTNMSAHIYLSVHIKCTLSTSQTERSMLGLRRPMRGFRCYSGRERSSVIDNAYVLPKLISANFGINRLSISEVRCTKTQDIDKRPHELIFLFSACCSSLYFGNIQQ